jgi:3'-phosphoadenosine 5'-phosphosulfate sulfotransferase (PAPS reductase)/FAD synthetase
MRSEDRERFLLWSRLGLHRRRVARAEAIVREALERMKNPYVAWSTGKDSTVVLDLVRRFKPDVPVVYLDAHCGYPETYELIDEYRKDGVNVILWNCEPFLKTLKDEGITVDSLVERRTMETTVRIPVLELMEHYGFDGVFMGLRAEESVGRRKMARSKGMLFKKKNGTWSCNPILWFMYDDVWAYIVSRGLKYNRLYDKMDLLPEENRRISYWAGESERSYGRWVWLMYLHPELFNVLAEEVPEARSFL